MIDSVRENAITAMVNILQEITTANGYSFDPTVYRAVRELTDPSQPSINVWDQGEETVHNQRSFEQAMSVQIEASIESNGGNFSIIGNQLIADCKKAIFSADPEMGGLSEYINLESSRIDYPDKGTIVQVTIEIVIGYRESRGDPAIIPQ